MSSRWTAHGWLLAAVGAAAVVAGCGGSRSGSSDDDSSGASGGTTASGGSGGGGGTAVIPATQCDPFTACGGDVVGRWRIAKQCRPSFSMPAVPECADAESGSTLGGDETFDFRSDGSLVLSGTLVLDAELAYTEACSQALTPGTSAAARCDAQIAAPTFSGNDGAVQGTFTCRMDGAVCKCHVHETIDAAAAMTARYSVSGNQISLIESGGDSMTTTEYCVKGNELDMHDAVADPTNYGALERIP